MNRTYVLQDKDIFRVIFHPNDGNGRTVKTFHCRKDAVDEAIEYAKKHNAAYVDPPGDKQES